MSPIVLTYVLLVASLQPCIAVLYSYTPAQAAALGTFAYSGTQLQDGDIIELAPGVYNVPINAPASTNGGVNIGIWFKNRCAAGARVTLRGQAGSTYPILTFAANTHIGLLLNDPQGVKWTVQHLHLKGINDGAATAANTQYCFFHKAWDSVLDDVKIETCATGMNSHDTESGSLTMQYCEVMGCGNGVLSHQLYASTSQTDPTVVFTLRHSYLHDGKGGNAIKSRFPSNLIEYNWVDHTAPAGLTIYRPLEMIGGQDVLSPPLGNSQSNVVGNVFVKTDAGGNFGLSRIGFDGTGNSRGRYRFVANTWIGSATQTTGITLWGEVMSASFYDNIFYLPGSGQRVVNLAPEYTGATPAWSASNNWVYTGTSVAQFTTAGVTFGTVSGTDPGFSSLATWDLRLLATSVCRGAGVNPPPNPNLTNTLVIPSTAVTNSPTRGKTTSATAVARPTGAVDIGAFAAIAAPTTPPTTVPVTTKPPTTAPVTAPPTTVPVTTKPPTTAPITAPPTTVPVTTKPPTTVPTTTVPPTTAPVTTKPPTTAPLPTSPAPGTTVPVTTVPPTTAPSTTRPATSAPITTPPVGTTPSPTAPTTTAPATTAPPATTVPGTTRPATTAPATTPPATTQPGATSPAPSQPATTAPATTAPATAAPATAAPTSVGPDPSPAPSSSVPPTATPAPSSAPTGTPQPSDSPISPGASCLLHIYTKGCASSSVLVSALATATSINPSDITVKSYGTCPDAPTDPHLILSIADGNCVATQTAFDAITAVNQTTGGVVNTAFVAAAPKSSKSNKFPLWVIGVIIAGVIIVAALVAVSVWLLLKGRHAKRPTVRSEWGTDMAGLYSMPGTL